MVRTTIVALLASLLLLSCVRLAGEPELLTCELDSDCIDGESCIHFQCRPAGSCVSGSDCGDRQICEGGQCRDVECINDTQCAVGQICSSGRVCIDVECTRTRDDACGDYACYLNECLTSCVTANDCNPEAPSDYGYGCISGSCTVLECDETSCSDSYACLDGQCATSCADDSNCQAEFYCDSSQCLARLNESEPCQADNECKSEACCPGYGCAPSGGCAELVCEGSPLPCSFLTELGCGKSPGCTWTTWTPDGACRGDELEECPTSLGETCTDIPGCDVVAR